MAERRAHHPVVAEAPQEGGVVLVEAETGAQPLDALARGAEELHGPVRALPGVHELGPVRARERRGQDVVAKGAGGVGGEPAGEAERVRPTRPYLRFDHREFETSETGRAASSAARSSTSSASDSRPSLRRSFAHARKASVQSRRGPCSPSRSVARRNASSAPATSSFAPRASPSAHHAVPSPAG